MSTNYIFLGLKDFFLWLMFFWFVLHFISYAINRFTRSGADDSDPPNSRSNLVVLTDYKTGLQYLSTAKGGIIPRLDVEGKQIIQVKP